MTKIIGLDKVILKLTAISDKAAEKGITRGIRKGCKRIEGSAKKYAAVDTSRLRGGVTSRVEKEPNKIIGATGTVVTHAAPNEFGTGQRGAEADIPSKAEVDVSYREDWPGMAPQPFLYPALQDNRELAVQDIATEVKKELAKYEKR